MIKKIILATDFSALSRQTLGYTIALAQKTGAKIIATHAVKEPSPIYLPIELPKDYHRELIAQTHARLEDFLGHALPGETEIEPRVCEGVPEQAVTALAVQEKADLLVVAKHSRSGLQRFLVGSVAEKILWQTRHPVVVFPDNGARTVNWKPLICATDCSDPSRDAFRFSAQLALDCSANLELVHVVEATPFVEGLRLLPIYNDRLLFPSGNAALGCIERG